MDVPSCNRSIPSAPSRQAGKTCKLDLIQRRTDLIHWEDWKTMDLEDNTCEAVDLTTGESKYFYRALEAPTETG